MKTRLIAVAQRPAAAMLILARTRKALLRVKSDGVDGKDDPWKRLEEADVDRYRLLNHMAVSVGRLPPNVWPLVRITSRDEERCPWLSRKGNPPQLPRELPERCILLASNPGDLVIDPFNGNGITGIAAILNDRRYIGIDRDKKGLEHSRQWIEHQVPRLKGKHNE